MLAAALCVGLLVCHSAAQTGSFIWQGFGYEWLHHIGPFETPHRLGSFASRLTNQSVEPVPGSSQAWNVTGEYYTALSPGVTGDFAHPVTAFTAVVDPAGLTVFRQHTVTFAFEDVSSNGTAPQANYSVNTSVTEVLPSSNAVLLVAGFDVQMKCVDDGVCNSNASWIYQFALNVSAFDPQTATGTLQFTLNRAWTPTGGGGKPFNERMSFAVTVDFTYISSSSSSFAVARSSSCVQSDIYQPITQRTSTMQGDFGDAAVVLGVGGFSWQLFETDGLKDIGRYFEAVQFLINGIVAQSSSELAFNTTVAILAPWETTFPAHLQHCIDVLAISMPASTLVSSPRQVYGNICENSDSIVFKCESVHMPVQLSDQFEVSVVVGDQTST